MPFTTREYEQAEAHFAARLRSEEFLKRKPEYRAFREANRSLSLAPVDRVVQFHTPSQIQALLSYDPSTGVLTRKNGVSFGRRSARGYLYVSIDDHQYLGHRLAWVCHYGKWPDGVIDHIDHDKTNDRIVNLRDVTHRENCENIIAPPSHNTSGYLGASFDKRKGKYRAFIKVLGKQKHLGYFDDPAEAHAAYVAAKIELHAGNTLELPVAQSFSALIAAEPNLHPAFAAAVTQSLDKHDNRTPLKFRARNGAHRCYATSAEAIAYERAFDAFPTQPWGLPDSAAMDGYRDAEQVLANSLTPDRRVVELA